MGANKNDFMSDREAEELNFAEQLRFEEKSDAIASVKSGLNAMPELIEFEILEFENGNISALDLALKFRGYTDNLKSQIEKMDNWIKENKLYISDESEKYPEGYHGYKVVLQTRETKSFKNIDEWVKLEKAKKDFEAKSIAALNMVRKGGLNVDENGEYIPLPEITSTSFILFSKLK